MSLWIWTLTAILFIWTPLSLMIIGAHLIKNAIHAQRKARFVNDPAWARFDLIDTELKRMGH